MSTQPEWQRVWDVFEQALTQPAGERAGWVAGACGEDQALRREVEGLLAAHNKPGGLLDARLQTVASEALANAEDPAISDEWVGPYRVVSEIGRGGMGIVYKAEDPRLDRFVALKFLPRYLTANDQAKKRLVAEARAASRLDHPNICTVHDIGETRDGRLFFAMAYYEGRPLDRRIEEGPLPAAEVVEIVRQVARGLGVAHQAGVIHRDIKPSNIFLTERGEAKILDFGLAKHGLIAQSESGVLVGTMAYMSPEQVTGAGLDHRTDLWSLGVTIYEMLSGRKPFRAHSEASVLYEIVHAEPPDLPPGIPEPLAGTVLKLLAKDPRDRFSSAAEVVAALDARPAHETPPAAGLLRNLPSYLTSFIGREAEIEEIKRLLSQTRLLTLTGPGGGGKTRLSAEVAQIVGSEFRDGACFVALATIDDPGLVVPAIAKALGVAECPGVPAVEQIVNSLRSRNLLLVVDNFEQVLEAAPAITRVLGACPEVKAIVTSRAVLQVSGEQEFSVPPLEVPRRGRQVDPETVGKHSAVRLFVERAGAARPSFRLDEGNARDVAELCVRLDGLPLAIELAAARIKLFSPQALLARLGERLDLLKGSARDLPARHRTLRQAIAWSYDLLDQPARRLFRRLSVFAGGWSLEAAESVCACDEELESSVFDLLSSLADQSLIRQAEDPQGEPRFWMLETIRAFGREELESSGEEAAAGQAHARYFLDLAERAGPELTGGNQTHWLNRLELEHDNLRAALAWATQTGKTETGVRLGAAMWRFWIARGYIDEGVIRLEALLSRPDGRIASEARVHALNGLGTLCHYLGEFLKARDVLQECLELGRARQDRHGIATALNSLGWVYCWLGELDAACEFSREALALHTELGDRRGAALALNNLGWVANILGEYHNARPHHERSLAIRREIRDQRGIAFALTNLAWAEQYHGNYVEASRLLDEAQEILRPVQDMILVGWTLINRARVARDQGDLDQALEELEKGLALWSSGGNRAVLALTKTGLGGVLHQRGQRRRAVQLLTEALDVWKQLHCPWGVAINRLEAGRAMMGADDAAATALVRESLGVLSRVGDRRGVAECLEELALLSRRAGNTARAAELLSLAAGLRDQIEAPLPPARSLVLRDIAFEPARDVSVQKAAAAGLAGG